MKTVIEVTVNRLVATDDNKKQNIPVAVTLNWDHVRSVQARIEGGSIITFPGNEHMIVQESRKSIMNMVLGIAPQPKKKSRKRASIGKKAIAEAESEENNVNESEGND